jgi:hypothetical protein
MRKLARFPALVACAASLTVPAMVSAQTAGMSERISQVAASLGFKTSDLDRLAQGEIVSRDLKGDSEKELALAVAMVVKAPFRDIFDRVQKRGIEEVDKTILSHGVLPEEAASTESFANLKLDSGELDKLLEVEPGSDFNLSQSEVEKLKGVAKVNQSAPIAQQREEITQAYREILAQRVNAYREAGLAGIAPFTRGGKESRPAEELRLAIEEMKVIENGAPNFYRAFKSFPADASASAENLFTWQIQNIQDRPTTVLVHRMLETHENYAVAGHREYFVGQSFNSLQLIIGAFPFGEETLLFYTNRTFTDQVAGFGSGTKRKIGREMMLGEVVKLLETVRASF